MGRRGRSLLLVAVFGVAAGRVHAQQPTPISGGAAERGATVIQTQAASIPTDEELAVKVLREGSSTKAVREQARKAFPWAQLTAEQQRTANLVLSDISLFRRLPAVTCPIDSRTYQYFLESPDVAVSIWRTLGISRLQLQKTNPNSYNADTLDGSSGTVQVLLRTPTQYVAYCDGMFKSPMLPKPIKARTVVVLHTSLTPRADGLSDLVHSVDMFVTFPSLAVETIAKLVSPLSYKYADRNMEEITSFLRMMDLSMARQPTWIEQVAGTLDGIDAQQRDGMIKLTAAVAVDAERHGRVARTGAVQSAAATSPSVTK